MFEVTIIDYGVGNLTSIRNAFQSIGVPARTAKNTRDVQDPDLLVLPGVGAFSHCMEEIARRGFTEFLIDYSLSGKPLLGICVGMQVLFEESAEFGATAGLGVMPGRISRLEASVNRTDRVKVPHVGWAPLKRTRSWEMTVLDGLDSRAYYYFVHSYALRSTSPETLADVSHGPDLFGAVVGSGMTVGCQFYPERSGPAGLSFLRTIVTNVSHRAERKGSVDGD